MKSKFLARRLEKSKGPSFVIAFRISRGEAEELAKVETGAGMKFDGICRVLFRSLIRHWDEKKELTLPVYVAIMPLSEARRLGLPDTDKPEIIPDDY